MEQLPAEFIKEIQALLGQEDGKNLELALHEEPSVSIRLNSSKGFVLDRLVDDFFERIPWSTTGFYLKDRPAFTFDPLFHAGGYYVQEASSMFLEQVLQKYGSKPVVALDLCAAPGGKSTHICSLLPQNSLLICNEVVRSRSYILAENMIKWGHSGVVVTNNQPADFGELTHFFDVIFTDVPCSGEGMFRKDPGAIHEWSAENVEICWRRQRKILAEVWNSLKPGGLLVYSTCTYNRKENEENIKWVMDEFGAKPLSVDILPDWGITDRLFDENLPTYRFLPHKTKGEGFFMAVLQKPDNDYMKTFRFKSTKRQSPQLAVPSECKFWLNDSEQFVLEWVDATVIAIPKYADEQFRILQQKMKVIHAGVWLAQMKGKDLIPLHSIAMATGLNVSAFAVAEVDYEQAISYLRKETITLSEKSSKGYVLLMYKHVPIGFVKNLGNRTNNLYPQEWRIRSGYNSSTSLNLVSKT